MMEGKFELRPVERMSYNEFKAKYGDSWEDFTIHSLAYMLQCRQADVDWHTRADWEEKLTGTRYDARAQEGQNDTDEDQAV